MGKEETNPIVEKQEINITVKKEERNIKNIYKLVFLKILPITILSMTLITFTLIKIGIITINFHFFPFCLFSFCQNNYYSSYTTEEKGDGDCTGDSFKEILGVANNANYDEYNVLINLPDNQKAFLEEAPHGKKIEIGICNEDKSNCCVYHEYRIENYKDIPPCFVVNLDKPAGSYYTNLTARAYSNPSECYKAT